MCVYVTFSGLGKPLDKIRKPVTASDRQKEREEKRRKQKEKRRKKLESQNVEVLKPELSNQDKDLLERWTKMQQVVKLVTTFVIIIIKIGP